MSVLHTAGLSEPGGPGGHSQADFDRSVNPIKIKGGEAYYAH